MRNQAINYMVSNEEEFRPYHENDVSFTEYCDKMRTDGVWGGYMELYAVSKTYGCAVLVYEYSLGTI